MKWKKLNGTKAYGTGSRKRATRRLVLEALEDRQLLATCNVVRLGDFGAGGTIGSFSRGDLRFCINKANDEPGPDTILIQVSGTINLTGPLPDLASDIEIVGPGSGLLTIRRDTGGDYRLITVAGDSAGISGVTLANGRADVGGGIYNQGSLTLHDVTVTSNTSTAGLGGGIYNAGMLTISGGSRISGNASSNTPHSYGGGLYNSVTGTVDIDSSFIEDNRTTGPYETHWFGYGGGVFNAGTMSINRSTISTNLADANLRCEQDNTASYGGGIRSEGILAITNSSVVGNIAHARNWFPCFDHALVAFGGGISIENATTTILNSTIADNEGSTNANADVNFVFGGGVAQQGSGTLWILHSTIAGNRLKGDHWDDEFGGGLSRFSGTSEVHVRNSVVANNVSDGSVDIWATLTSSGYNLFGTSAGGSGYAPTDILDVDPLLGELADNGGPTLTMALLSGSPAIDAGDPNPANPPEWDQRGPGFPRIVNGRLDIGAFEVQASGLPNVSDSSFVLATADLSDVFVGRTRRRAFTRKIDDNVITLCR